MPKIGPEKIILVTDDNEHTRYTVSRYLHRAGFEVWEAATGEETLRLSQRQPSLILLDIKLPDINGFEVCRRIKANPATAGTPVVHISSTFQGIQHKIQGLEGGADGYMTTPIEPEELIATVNAFLRIRKAESTAQLMQRRLSIAQKAARIGTFEWNIADNELTWTREMELLYGLKPGEFKNTYQAWAERVHPDDLPEVELKTKLVLAGNGDVQVEFRILAPDGSTKWMLSRSEVIRDEDGKPVQVIGVNIDITDRKHNEEQLREAQTQLRRYADDLEHRVRERTAKLEETIQDLEAFSYSVSHDLRTPLRAMQGYSQYLLEDCSGRLDENGKKYLDRISAASARLDQLVQDILTYSRIARADLKLKPIELEKLIRDIIQQYPEFHPPNAAIEIKAPLLNVLSHESALAQCISNILDNAVKFVRKNAMPRIHVWTTRSNSHVRLWFKDNGIGIAPEHHSRLFKMFERVHGGAQFEGTGIGLAIVKKAVERMGGTVGLDSELGKGSVFWLQLPRA